MRVARVQRLLHHVVALGTQPHRRAVLTNLREYADTHMLLVCGGMRTDMQQPHRRAVLTNLQACQYLYLCTSKASKLSPNAHAARRPHEPAGVLEPSVSMRWEHADTYIVVVCGSMRTHI
jgi:hypothetical protein